MKGKLYDTIITAIDVGTTKICVLVARPKIDGSIEIIALGKSESDGLRKGVVVDIDRTIVSIKKAVQDAELMAGCTLESAIVGISGSHVQSTTSHGVVPIKKSEVSSVDIANVIASAQAIPLEQGQQILHVLPQHFVIDGGAPISNPIGMYGVRLEVTTHIVTGSVACVQNLIKCCQMAGLKVQDVVLEQIASAQAVLSHDELELGVGIIDIGGGTSDVAVYEHKNMLFTMVIPVAGNHFTHDIAQGLRTTIYDAERIKKEFGTVDHTDSNTQIFVEDVQGAVQKNVSQDFLFEILKARAAELMTIINRGFIQHNLKKHMVAGVVLTGGGALLNGIDNLARSIFGVPVRIGLPHINHLTFESLAHPMYATGYGLLVYAQQQKKNNYLQDQAFSRLFHRMKTWVADFF